MIFAAISDLWKFGLFIFIFLLGWMFALYYAHPIDQVGNEPGLMKIFSYYYMYFFGDFGTYDGFGDAAQNFNMIMMYLGSVLFSLILINVFLAIIVNGWD